MVYAFHCKNSGIRINNSILSLPAIALARPASDLPQANAGRAYSTVAQLIARVNGRLDPFLCDRVDKQLSFLLQNPRHRSLRLKRLVGTDRFEIRITAGYRLTFRYDEEVIELRRIGSHDLLKKEGS